MTHKCTLNDILDEHYTAHPLVKLKNLTVSFFKCLDCAIVNNLYQEGLQMRNNEQQLVCTLFVHKKDFIVLSFLVAKVA